jgi:porphobilinogen synthase
MKHHLSHFPQIRMRRLRSNSWIRQIIAEVHLNANDLILPIFIREPDEKDIIESLPGVKRHTINELPKLVEKIINAGIHAVALFPCTPIELKNDKATEALNPDNLICRAIQQIKYYNKDIGIIADVALDPYTNHGHDGLLINNKIENDETVALLCQQSLILSQAGADIIAPSDMMDGRVGAIRQYLDRHSLQEKIILSYAVKYASAFYGPFRDAVGVHGLLGPKDKKTYQMSPANRSEAMREIALDLQEGADIIMIKPGLPYLDILFEAHQTFPCPLFSYQVSGEYAMIKNIPDPHISQNMMLETLLSFKRAGASGILTYAALEIAEFLKGQS